MRVLKRNLEDEELLRNGLSTTGDKFVTIYNMEYPIIIIIIIIFFFWVNVAVCEFNYNVTRCN